MAKLFNTLTRNMFSSSKKKSSSAKEEVDLFTPWKVGEIGEVSNRIAMAPMTRARATNDGVVGKHHIDYYTQRANAGLMVTEGTNISQQAIGWWCSPNIFTEEQVAAWKPVTDSVHKAGGKIVCQLWHTGRVSHSDYQDDNQPPVGPSAIAANGDGVRVPGSWETKPYEVPRALTTEEIPELIKTYVAAAKNAIFEAGFDGIEVHCANGYLLDEFLQSKTNQREDKYGGSLENRVRLTDELLTALIKEVPAGKIGIRFSPNGVYNDMGSADNLETFNKAIEVAAKHKIAYIHIMDGLGFGFHKLTEPYTLKMAMDIIKKVQPKKRVTTLMGNCGYTKEDAEAKVKSGDTDMIAFGRPYIANPDLVTRFKKNIKLAEKEGYAHYYTPNADDPSVGYSDFTSAEEAK